MNFNTFAIAILLLFSSNSAYQASDVNSSPPATSQTETDHHIPLNQTCINSKIGYQVSYPQGWQTNSGTVVDRCRVFDPQSAILPKNTESTSKAIYLRIEKNISFEEVAEADISEQQLSKQTITVANNQAVVIESESTGKALLRKGIRKYSYIVDLDKQTLIATTYEIPGNDYQTNKQILDRMMATIEFSDRPTTNN